MQKDTRILEAIQRLRRRLEDNWEEELERLNIADELYDFYNEIGDRLTANTIFAFIVFAYDASSEYIETTKDRLENKKSILIRLAGPSCLTKAIYVDALMGDTEGGNQGIIDKTIEWYINRQRDWRWTNIMSGMEFYSKAVSMQSTASTISDMRDMGVLLREAEARREKAEAYLEQIKNEYVDIDGQLDKEKRIKMTDRLRNDYTGWELHVLQLKERQRREEEEKNIEATVKDEESPI